MSNYSSTRWDHYHHPHYSQTPDITGYKNRTFSTYSSNCHSHWIFYALVCSSQCWHSYSLSLSLSQTSSNNVQEIIESRVEKRIKGVYVPVGGKNMLVFLDDLNMPAVDDFGSQPPLELLRLWIDYGFWYDRQKQTLKSIKVSHCMWSFHLQVYSWTWVGRVYMSHCVMFCSKRTFFFWLRWGLLVEGGLTYQDACGADLISSTWPSLQ